MSERDRAPRALAVACAAGVGFALAYALPVYARLPSLYYDPLARRWILGAWPGPLPIGWYGQLAYGVAGAAVASSLASLASRLRAPSPQVVALASAWALTALALVLAYFAWNNWP